MTAEEKEKERLMLLSLNGDDERWVAYVIAMYLKSGAYKTAGAMLGDSPRMLRLVADAREGKFRPRPICEKIIRAYWAARMAAARTGRGIDIDAFLDKPRTPPTLREVKQQFVRLFIKEQRPAQLTESHWLQELKDRKEIPADYSIRKVLDRLHLPWRKDKCGPRGPWRTDTEWIKMAFRKSRN